MKTTKGGFTRGPWIQPTRYSPEEGRSIPCGAIEVEGGRIVACLEGMTVTEWANDANLIAAAGTAATKVEDMSYDGLEAVKALPEILKILKMFYEPRAKGWKVTDWDLRLEDANALLARIKGEGKEAEDDRRKDT